jgi:hypothetical protein
MSKVLLTALLLMSTSLMAEDLVPVGLQKQLLVDDYVIAQKHNITRVLGKVKKVGIVSKPTLESDFHPKWKKPDGSRVGLDYGYYTSVAYNDKQKKFQMWYMGGVQGRFHSPRAGQSVLPVLRDTNCPIYQSTRPPFHSASDLPLYLPLLALAVGLKPRVLKSNTRSGRVPHRPLRYFL